MSFLSDIYPLRTRRREFAMALLERMDYNWTRVTTVGHGSAPPGGARCRSVGTRTPQCDYAPSRNDKQRLTALLNGWKWCGREGRYLDLERVGRFENQRMSSRSVAFEAIRQNRPAGAVMFLHEEIERSRTPHFFGPGLWDGWGYDQYYSNLLYWDDHHCHGLIPQVAFRYARTRQAGAPSIHPVWRAARYWLTENRTRGPYRYYVFRFEEDEDR
jgi:hypothetical protein